MTTPRSILLVGAGLVIGVGGALSAPVAFSAGPVGSLDSSAAKAGAKATSSVVVCITRKRVVRGAGAKSGCPKGTTRKRVGVRGPKGKPGPGAKPINLMLSASATTFVAVGAGMSFGCRSGANHITMGLTSSTSTARGLLIRDQAGAADTVPWEAGQAVRNAETFAIGEFTGRNTTSARLAHLSVAARWVASSSSCEVIGTLTPTE